MKKNLNLAVMIILVIISLTLLVACNPNVIQGNTEVINVPQGEYSTLEDVLVAMQGDGTIELEYSSSDWGIYITKIARKNITLSNDNISSTYISLYTSSSDVQLIDLTASPVILNNQTFYVAGVGASDMPYDKNTKYLFCTVTFGTTNTINEGYIIFE